MIGINLFWGGRAIPCQTWHQVMFQLSRLWFQTLELHGRNWHKHEMLIFKYTKSGPSPSFSAHSSPAGQVCGHGSPHPMSNISNYPNPMSNIPNYPFARTMTPFACLWILNSHFALEFAHLGPDLKPSATKLEAPVSQPIFAGKMDPFGKTPVEWGLFSLFAPTAVQEKLWQMSPGGTLTLILPQP